MTYDVAIIGGGMAGASLAAHLGDGVSAVMLEAEDSPGYHSTGRSAAFYTETYGGPNVQPLTTASKDWFFSTYSIATDALMVQRRGALHVGWNARSGALQEFHAEMAGLSPKLDILGPESCVSKCSILKQDGLTGGVYDPDCCDIDVAAVHSHFLRQSRHSGVQALTNFRVVDIERKQGLWHLRSATGDTVVAQRIVNAAGAWADAVAHLAGASPLGLSPKRRTIAVFEMKNQAANPDWPLLLDLAETFYFKPEGKNVLISPADETPSQPCDVQPEVEDVAIAAHRFEDATGVELGRCKAKWAGLRTFAPDRAPIYGFDEAIPDFFWCAGQGGFGIQTAPAAGQLSASLLLGNTVPEHIFVCGISADRYAPQRFLTAA